MKRKVDTMNNDKFITYKTANYGKQLNIFYLCSSATIIDVIKETKEDGSQRTVLAISIDKAEREEFREALNNKNRLGDENFRKAKDLRKKAMNEYYENIVEE